MYLVIGSGKNQVKIAIDSDNANDVAIWLKQMIGALPNDYF